MDSSPDQKPTAAPSPEVLAPRADDSQTDASENAPDPVQTQPADAKRPRRNNYRPSHKGTFMALAVVIAILTVNAAAIAFVLKGGKNKTLTQQDQVTISQGVLDKVGVNRSSINDAGLELVVGPNARFNGKVQVGGSVSVAGSLNLNSKFTAADASLTQLEAGKTAVTELNVNGNSTLSNLNLRNDLQVTGKTTLQGPTTITQLLTVSNSVNVSGNVSVGGTLSTNGLSVHALSIDSSLTVGGHFITRGSAPGVSAGGAVGSNGTVSISGNDAAGTVAVNIGVGASAGTLANISFRNVYGGTPHVVITPIGAGVGSFYVNRSAGGFSIGVSGGLAPGGYAFDYIVEQ